MKINPIISVSKNSRPMFKGTFLEDRYSYPGKELGTTHLGEAMRTGRRYEKTLGEFHEFPKGELYYADPLEVVSDAVKERVDYIIYDDMPRFPDIDTEVSRRYFFEPTSTVDNHSFRYGTNLLKNKDKGVIPDMMNKVREYFYRLEQADGRTVADYEKKANENVDMPNSRARAEYFKAHVNDAKYNQETIARCLDLYNEAAELINRKDETYLIIEHLKNRIKNHSEDMKNLPKDIKHREELNEILTSRINRLEELKKQYQGIIDGIDNAEFSKNYEKLEHYECDKFHYNTIQSYTTKDPKWGDCYGLETPFREAKYWSSNEFKIYDTKQKTEIKKKLDELASPLKELQSILKFSNKILNDLKNCATEYPKLIESWNKELAEKEVLYEKLKAELIPHFDKLKNYFKERGGLKVIK